MTKTVRPGNPLARLHGVKLSVPLFDMTGRLVPGNRGADMARASPLACGGDFLPRLAGCQGKDLIAEARRAALAASWFSPCSGGEKVSEPGRHADGGKLLGIQAPGSDEIRPETDGGTRHCRFVFGAGTDLALQSRHPASLLKRKASPQNVGGDAQSRGQREAPGPHKYSRARIGMNRRFRRIAAVLEDDD